MLSYLISLICMHIRSLYLSGFFASVFFSHTLSFFFLGSAPMVLSSAFFPYLFMTLSLSLYIFHFIVVLVIVDARDRNFHVSNTYLFLIWRFRCSLPMEQPNTRPKRNSKAPDKFQGDDINQQKPKASRPRGNNNPSAATKANLANSKSTARPRSRASKNAQAHIEGLTFVLAIFLISRTV